MPAGGDVAEHVSAGLGLDQAAGAHDDGVVFGLVEAEGATLDGEGVGADVGELAGGAVGADLEEAGFELGIGGVGDDLADEVDLVSVDVDALCLAELGVLVDDDLAAEAGFLDVGFGLAAVGVGDGSEPGPDAFGFDFQGWLGRLGFVWFFGLGVGGDGRRGGGLWWLGWRGGAGGGFLGFEMRHEHLASVDRLGGIGAGHGGVGLLLGVGPGFTAGDELDVSPGADQLDSEFALGLAGRIRLHTRLGIGAE